MQMEWRELHHPILSIEKNIEVLRTLIPETLVNPQIILGEIAKDVGLIKKSSKDICLRFPVRLKKG